MARKKERKEIKNKNTLHERYLHYGETRGNRRPRRFYDKFYDAILLRSQLCERIGEKKRDFPVLESLLLYCYYTTRKQAKEIELNSTLHNQREENESSERINDRFQTSARQVNNNLRGATR